MSGRGGGGAAVTGDCRLEERSEERKEIGKTLRESEEVGTPFL